MDESWKPDGAVLGERPNRAERACLGHSNMNLLITPISRNDSALQGGFAPEPLVWSVMVPQAPLLRTIGY